MQFEWLFGPKSAAAKDEQWLEVGARRVRLWFVRHRRARRYVLRLRADGGARVTVPRGGSVAEARRFAARHTRWLEQQLLKQAQRPPRNQAWPTGTEILYRGNRVRLEPGVNGHTGCVCFGDQVVRVADAAQDCRPAIEHHLRQLATTELSARVVELATAHLLPVKRVTVRNQRSRWGSCSRRGTISLNWRLVQAPAFVRDYIIYHELAHLREMNHSRRFWAEVARLCPEYPAAEQWLRAHADLLH